MKKKSVLMMIMVISLIMLMAVPTLASKSGGGGEGDDCVATWVMKNVGPPYTGTLIGYQDGAGRIWLNTPDGSPLTRGGNTKCEMTISSLKPYAFGVFSLPEKPKEIIGVCRTAIKDYDTCLNYDVWVGAYEVIDASKPKYIDPSTFTIDVVIMPLQVIPY
jgi:hypothetical protein